MAVSRPEGASMVSDQVAPTLSTEQLSEFLSLIRGADSVELKLSVADADRRSAIDALEMDPIDAEIRQVGFFDTPDLRLNDHGLVVRTRRIQDSPGDTVVKLRPVVPDNLPEEWRDSPSFSVEVDAMPGGFVCSASMKAERAADDVKDVMKGQAALKSVLTKEQRDFYKANAPDGIKLGDLVLLGPITLLKLKFTPEGFDRRMVAELWFYPDGSRILELSTKCAPADAFLAAAETKAFLGGHGIDLSAQQQTKTKTALQYFASQLS
jgi:hypothetical protein